MRLLWSLPKAAPALLRHFVAYVELAGHDLEQTRRDLGARLLVSFVLVLCVFFSLLSLCLIVLALSWDTPYRLAALLAMGGVFVASALVAALYRSKLIGRQTVFLGTVRREWDEDRLILDKILADQD